jgi:two-component system, sensor histidine kinase
MTLPTPYSAFTTIPANTGCLWNTWIQKDSKLLSISINYHVQYHYKFKQTKIDGIICSDNNALDFYLKYGAEIWGNTPVSFCGINNPEAYNDLVDSTMVFGVAEKLNIKQNLTIALELHPNIKEFIVIGDKTLLFPLFYEQFQQAIEKIDGNVGHQLIIIENTDQLADTFKHLELKNRAIYLLSLYVNRNGVPKEMALEARFALKKLQIPVFGDWDFLMPDLITGGSILRGADQGHDAAAILNAKLNGIEPMQFAMPSKHTLVFDYNQMQKFGIYQEQLPPGSQVIYKNLSVWEKYKLEIAGMLSVVIILIIIIITLIHSIILRKKSELELIESESRLELALEGANQGLWDLNLNEKFIYINKEFAFLLGYSSPKEMNLNFNNWATFIHPNDLMAIKEAYALHKSGKTNSMNCEIRMLKKDGNYTWVSIHGKITAWQLNLPIRVVGSLMDISDQKAFEDQLRFAKNKAEESDRLKSSFLANMSHEIRTPMNVIIGFSDLVNSGIITDSERQTYLNQIKHSSENLLCIINDIIDISKIESGQMNIIKDTFDLNQLLKKICKTAEALIIKNEKNIRFIGPHIDEQPRFINSDAQRLEQVLLNLITNAIKFTQDGKIELGVRDDSFHSMSFYVRDTGLGIAPEHTSVIFERFRQGDETLAKKFGGTGLGLAISKNLVSLLGGTIQVESEPKKGSIFTFSISKT